MAAYFYNVSFCDQLVGRMRTFTIAISFCYTSDVIKYLFFELFLSSAVNILSVLDDIHTLVIRV